MGQILCKSHREANELESEAQSCAVASWYTHARAHCVKNGKDNRGEDREGGNLIQREGALRDEDGGGGNYKTLDEILDNAIDNFSKSVTVHVLIITAKKKTHTPMSQSIRV